VPLVGDGSSAAERAADPAGWALPPADAEALRRVIGARRDIRRFRPDPLPGPLLLRLLDAAHQAPSVGHSQPWRFVVVRDPRTRAAAAVMADRCRLEQARRLDAESGRHLLDLDLEGIREAPIGIVVCCDRRTPAAGVLGRATFADADLWSCACAIENLWLAARAEGVGVGWVTLFEPDALAALVGAPEGVVPLGWLCAGWPDERPPEPGLERRGWSTRLPLESVVLAERWPDGPAPPPPPSRLAPPAPAAVVAAHDSGDVLLSPPGSLGVLDRVLDRALAAAPPDPLAGATLVVVAADHPVAGRGVSAYPRQVTRSVAEASVAGRSMGAVAAARAGLAFLFADAGVDGPPLAGARCLRPRRPRGDLVDADGLNPDDTQELVAAGRQWAAEICRAGSRAVALGEVGVGNTTVAAALGSALLDCDPDLLVGLGAGADSAVLATKRAAVRAARRRVGPGDAMTLLARLGGAELAVLAGISLGASEQGALVVLDGLATGVAALVAISLVPAVAQFLVAGQRSREPGHSRVLDALGLEPLIDLRLRAGEGVGAALAVSMLRTALALRRDTARTG
jgi:nicotinate-nucleotide--dimethylbenzimidazole phosphoribosyltransferase